jgi:hypothetical protein
MRFASQITLPLRAEVSKSISLRDNFRHFRSL